MKIFGILFLSVLLFNLSSGQINSKEYNDLVKKADSLYDEKEYKSSAYAYSEAFKSNNWKGMVNDRYNAACSWSLAGFPDSAFFNLERIATIAKYSDYNHISIDPDLNSLHDNVRWKSLLEIIKSNKDKEEANLNQPLINELDSIYINDQKYRKMLDDSNDRNEILRIMREKDSVNLIQVKAIIDSSGWLGPDVVGKQGSTTLFLVIQHADLQTQEKYFPLMKEAVKNGKASGADLALMTDRIEIRNGRQQIYGSQITTKNGRPELYPIIDEKNVNKRRADVGLQPLEEYVQYWNIKYKLPEK